MFALRRCPAGVGLTRTQIRGKVTLVVRLEDDTEQLVVGSPSETLLEVLERSDLSDIWEGGACGGASSCSTCRVVLEPAVLDMLVCTTA